VPPFYDLDPNIKGDSFTRTDAEGASPPPAATPVQESSGCSLNPHPVPPGGRATWVLGSLVALAAFRRRRA
jgi:MYXO-CTERM domain-containing protein